MLVDDLATDREVVAVDISPSAIATLRARLPADTGVQFVVADVLTLHLDPLVDVWHDRATFHFFTDEDDISAYARRAAATVVPGGHLVMATFAPSGPEQCSGLDVQRHDAASLQEVFGEHFELLEATEIDHRTPWGAAQRFTHAVLRRT